METSIYNFCNKFNLLNNLKHLALWQLNKNEDNPNYEELDKEFKEVLYNDSQLDTVKDHVEMLYGLNNLFLGLYVFKYKGRIYILKDGSNGHFFYIAPVEEFVINSIDILFKDDDELNKSILEASMRISEKNKDIMKTYLNIKEDI